MLVYKMSKHHIVVVRYGIPDPRIIRYCRSVHTHITYNKCVTTLEDYCIKNLT